MYSIDHHSLQCGFLIDDIFVEWGIKILTCQAAISTQHDDTDYQLCVLDWHAGHASNVVYSYLYRLHCRSLCRLIQKSFGSLLVPFVRGKYGYAVIMCLQWSKSRNFRGIIMLECVHTVC